MADPSGRFVAGKHVFPVRVYYEDTDAGGVVYYASYLKFAERARTELMRLAGAEHTELLAAHDVLLAVRRCEIDYLRSAVLDDALEVHTEILELRGASITADQSVRRSDGEVARLRLRIACVTKDGRPARLPPGLTDALRPYCRNPVNSPQE